jgi:hypothetical protein
MKQQIPESWHLIFHGHFRFQTLKTFYNELIKYVSYLGYDFEIDRKPYWIHFWFDNKKKKNAMHHQKVQFLWIKIPFQTWKNVENSGFGKWFRAHRWNFTREKLKTAVGNDRAQSAAGWTRILPLGDPRMKYRTLKEILETQILKCNLTLKYV